MSTARQSKRQHKLVVNGIFFLNKNMNFYIMNTNTLLYLFKLVIRLIYLKLKIKSAVVNARRIIKVNDT